MKYILKTTLVKSNPNVVREFEIDASFTVKVLLQVIMLLHGWEAEGFLPRLEASKICLEETALISEQGVINTEETASISKEGATFLEETAAAFRPNVVISGETILKNIDFSQSLKVTMSFHRRTQGAYNYERKAAGSEDMTGLNCWTFRLEKTGERADESDGLASKTGERADESGGLASKTGERADESGGLASETGESGGLASEAGELACEIGEGEGATDGKTGIKANCDMSAPKLLRYRGFHPYIDESSMSDCNYDMCAIMNSGSFYTGWGYVSAGDFCVDIQEINNNIKIFIRKKQGSYIEVNRTSAKPLRKILESHDVTKLRRACEFNNLYTYGRKTGMVNQLEGHFNNIDFWKQLLDTMLYREYQQFKALCFDKNIKNVQYQFLYTLSQNCMVDDKGNVPLEFLDYFERRFNEEGDEEIQKYSRLNTALVLCSDFYYLFNKEALKDFYCMLFPDKPDMDFFENEVDKLFSKAENNENSDGYCSPGHGYIYWPTYGIDGLNVAKNLAADPVYNELPYFIPSQDEMYDALSYKAEFDYAAKYKIQSALSGYVNWDTLREEVIPRTYVFVRLGMTAEKIIQTIISEYRIKRFSKTAALEQVIRDARKNIPLIPLKGRRISDNSKRLTICGTVY